MSNPTDTPQPEAPSSTPGKLRTWWHPLLANLLRWQLEPMYQVNEEVPVGRMPLQLDIVLLRRTAGNLPESTRRMLTGLSNHLNEYTLLELKGPKDALAAGDFRTLVAYAHLYCAQNEPLLAAERLTLLVVAPRLTAPYRQEMRACNVSEQQDEPGIWRVGGAMPYPMWILETDVLAGLSHPLLTMFSPVLLRDPVQVMGQLKQAGYEIMVVYMGQQIQQFHEQGETFMMKHMGAEELEQMRKAFVEHLTLEERLQGLPTKAVLHSIPLEERLADLTPQERVQGLSLEQRVVDLSPEELERLKALLEQKKKQNP